LISFVGTISSVRLIAHLLYRGSHHSLRILSTCDPYKNSYYYYTRRFYIPLERLYTCSYSYVVESSSHSFLNISTAYIVIKFQYHCSLCLFEIFIPIRHDITLSRGCLIAGLPLVCTERVKHYYKSMAGPSSMRI